MVEPRGGRRSQHRTPPDRKPSGTAPRGGRTLRGTRPGFRTAEEERRRSRTRTNGEHAQAAQQHQHNTRRRQQQQRRRRRRCEVQARLPEVPHVVFQLPLAGMEGHVHRRLFPLCADHLEGRRADGGLLQPRGRPEGPPRHRHDGGGMAVPVGRLLLHQGIQRLQLAGHHSLPGHDHGRRLQGDPPAALGQDLDLQRRHGPLRQLRGNPGGRQADPGGRARRGVLPALVLRAGGGVPRRSGGKGGVVRPGPRRADPGGAPVRRGGDLLRAGTGLCDLSRKRAHGPAVPPAVQPALSEAVLVRGERGRGRGTLAPPADQRHPLVPGRRGISEGDGRVDGNRQGQGRRPRRGLNRLGSARAEHPTTTKNTAVCCNGNGETTMAGNSRDFSIRSIPTVKVNL
mmetsp:Transcript_13752/g.31713  ORF Transcript_13752/g.31713 Transcript_13752/m.31713 type:complete len:399 (-) Transcript_13752:785-1981(-)